jgi:hypothetical protein
MIDSLVLLNLLIMANTYTQLYVHVVFAVKGVKT